MYTLGTSSSNFRLPDGKELTQFFTVKIFLVRIMSLRKRVYASWVIYRKHCMSCDFLLFPLVSRIRIEVAQPVSSASTFQFPLLFRLTCYNMRLYLFVQISYCLICPNIVYIFTEWLNERLRNMKLQS